MACLGSKICLGLGKSFNNPQLLVVFPRWSPGIQAKFISSKVWRDKLNIKRPEPFPYEEKTFSRFQAVWDSTLKRFDENTKLIVVEGNIGVGKTTFAKQLAEQLDMLYLPEVSLDMHYINRYGHDLRDYAHLIPEPARPFDITDFYKTPNDKKVAVFQFLMYRHRFLQYVDGLAHMFNTGQGIVMERCAYSDYIFLETMHKFGYISNGAKKVYYILRNNTIVELLRPHLVIYLDAPLDVLQERIKSRGLDHENNTKVLSREYLQSIDDQYKNKYLKDIEESSELLIYDWRDFGEMEDVVEEIERIDFERFTRYDDKMTDWRLYNESGHSRKRYYYTSERSYILSLFNVPWYDAPELVADGDSMKQSNYVKEHVVPGGKYAYGYNEDMGDTGVLTKFFYPRRPFNH